MPVAGETGLVPPGSSDGQGGQQQHASAAMEPFKLPPHQTHAAWTAAQLRQQQLASAAGQYGCSSILQAAMQHKWQ